MKSLLGKPVRRKEDAALLIGKGRFADDVPVAPGTLSAHVIRSPHAHATDTRHRQIPRACHARVYTL